MASNRDSGGGASARRLCGAFFATVLTATLPGVLDSRPLERHFGPDDSCYRRVYSGSHLNSHPGQRVSAIRFDHFPRTYGTYDAQDNIRFNPETAELYFIVSVKFRDSDRVYEDGGFCLPDGGQYRCQIECDGGSFLLDDRDADSILLVNRRGFRISGCDEGPERILKPKPDDEVFRLDRLPDQMCTPPAQAAEQSGAISKQLTGVPKSRRPDQQPESDREPANDPGWTFFENAYSGWRVEYPSALLHEQPGDGNAAVTRFQSRNMEVDLIAYGTVNDFDSIAEFRNQTLDYGTDSGRYADVTYAPVGEDWFVLSGYRGNRIFYDKYVFSQDRGQVQAVLIEYPEYFRATYDDIVARIAKSFVYHSPVDAPGEKGDQDSPGVVGSEDTNPAPAPLAAAPAPGPAPVISGGTMSDWAMYPVNPGDYIRPPGLSDVMMKPTCINSSSSWNFLFTHDRGDLRATLDFEVMYQDLPRPLPPRLQPMNFFVSFGSDRDSIQQYNGGSDIPCSARVEMRFRNLKWFSKFGQPLEGQ